MSLFLSLSGTSCERTVIEMDWVGRRRRRRLADVVRLSPRLLPKSEVSGVDYDGLTAQNKTRNLTLHNYFKTYEYSSPP